MKLETIIGLEVHVQLKTDSKMFCSCSNKGENEPANTTVCPICLAHPGTLPVPNQKAIEQAIRLALSLDCEVNSILKFDRKNYFYPDLPKGYQISQQDEPLGKGGKVLLRLNNKEYAVRLERVHVEEDTGKSTHVGKDSLIDFNRAGTPLVEIVSKPDIHSPQEAKAYLQEIRLIVRTLGVSDADMEKGHLRCDANISLRPEGNENYYPKTEIKNLNSFRSVEKALSYEVSRQTKMWEAGETPTRLTTRGWDEKKNETVEQRVKEEAHDYRYFQEPDIPVTKISDDLVKKLYAELPELPDQKRHRFQEQYGFDNDTIEMMIADHGLASFTEEVISELQAWLLTLENAEGTKEDIWHENKPKLIKLISNWLINKLLKILSDNNLTIADHKVTPENFAEFIVMIQEKKINNTTALNLLTKMVDTGSDPCNLVESEDLKIAGGEVNLEKIIDKIIKDNPTQVSEYKAGKLPLFQYFVGLAMKETKGRVDSAELKEMLENKLK